MKNVRKLNALAVENNAWMEEALARRKNRAWEKHAQRIAFRILEALRERNMTQKQLAERMQVSPQQINKIVRGRENLTLQTIAKLEEALETDLFYRKKGE